MVLKSVGSRLFKVNLLSDFILELIPSEENTIIQVVDTLNFYVIKGKTSFKDPLNLSKAIDDFNSKYSLFFEDNFVKNIIDLIEYDVKTEKKESLKHSFFNSQNCSYSFKQIEQYHLDKSLSYDLNLNKLKDDTNLIVMSEFPFGYSLDQGRDLYYYGKHITYNIPSTYPFKELVLELSHNKENEDILFNVYNSFNEEYDEKLKSAILDIFDFDYTVLSNEMKKVDWSFELTDPLYEFECLKKLKKDFLMI